MKIIVTGATGTAGSEVLKQAVADPNIEKIAVLTRRTLGIQHPKIDLTFHSDFKDYSSIISQLQGYSACLWCLGVSQYDVSTEEYHVITYDYAVAAAKAMANLHPSFRFCFLSGSGADSTEKSRILFAKVKGKTENALTALGKPKAFHFRPGYIHGETAKKSIEKWVMHPLAPALYRLFPNSIISTEDLAKAMLKVAKEGAAQTIFQNEDIRNLVKTDNH